jgi:uncharacterized protein with PQ loop repeat
MNDLELNPSSSSSPSILKLSADFLMIFLPSFGYFFQAIKFQKTKSSKGFSKSLCLLLLLANILRIYFYIGRPFEKSLLYQSIVVIISQIYLIHYYLKYQERSKDELPPEKSILNHMTSWNEIITPSKIWKWDYEIDYYKFILFLFFFMSFICYLIGKDKIKFYDIIGTISVSIETFIEIPQIKENCATKNVKNLSGAMVLMWFIGDLFKSTYNIANNSPIQMIIGGLIQNCEDVILSSQLIIYGENGIANRLFKNRFKYFSLSNNEDVNYNKGIMNDKIEYDLEENNRDKMGELKIKSRINNNSSSKKNEFETEDDDINIDTDIGK